VRIWIPFLTLAAAGCLTPESRGDAAGDLAAHTAPAARASPQGGAGTALPAVTLRDLDDRPLRLESAAGGKPALVSFWATWCEACLTELDALNRLDDRARAGGGLVIGVAVGEPRDKAAAFARQHGLRYAQLVDEKLELADALHQKRLPATLVLDRQGQVVFVGGALDEKALAAFRGVMGP
jgi:peroxiredoxin